MAHRTNCINGFMDSAQKFAMFLEGNKKAADEGDTDAPLPHPGGWPLLQDPDTGNYIAMGLFPTPVLMRVQDLSSEELKYGFMHWRVSHPFYSCTGG
jgi:hypothetical protein